MATHRPGFHQGSMKIDRRRKPVRTRRSALSLLVLSLTFGGCADQAQPERPRNVVIFLADDLGYGDIHCLAPETSKIPTPSADQLASEGMIFTEVANAKDKKEKF